MSVFWFLVVIMHGMQTNGAYLFIRLLVWVLQLDQLCSCSLPPFLPIFCLVLCPRLHVAPLFYFLCLYTPYQRIPALHRKPTTSICALRILGSPVLPIRFNCKNGLISMLFLLINYCSLSTHRKAVVGGCWDNCCNKCSLWCMQCLHKIGPHQHITHNHSSQKCCPQCPLNPYFLFVQKKKRHACICKWKNG